MRSLHSIVRRYYLQNELIQDEIWQNPAHDQRFVVKKLFRGIELRLFLKILNLIPAFIQISRTWNSWWESFSEVKLLRQTRKLSSCPGFRCCVSYFSKNSKTLVFHLKFSSKSRRSLLALLGNEFAELVRDFLLHNSQNVEALQTHFPNHAGLAEI
jgi:hypothetical protein